MNSSPLPKPTPVTPAKTTSDSVVSPKQGVVFDQKQQDSNKASSRIPLAQKPTTTDTTTPLPPTSLSALSSMSSNKIPSVQTTPSTQPDKSVSVPTPNKGQPIPQMTQKTVLGRPLPQAIRGEATPTGLTGAQPGMLPEKPLINKTPGEVAKNSNLPNSSQSSGEIIKENPNIGDKNSKKEASKDKKNPQFAQAKSPIMKFIPFIAGGIVVLLLVVFGLSRLFGGNSSTSVADNAASNTGSVQQNTNNAQRTEVPSEKITLTYWGLWEPSEVMEEVISDFETQNPGISISYIKQSPVDYRERLQTAIQNGAGPDLFRFHASWVPMLKSSLDPIPTSVVSASEFKNNYYPIVTEQLVYSGQYVGLPLMYDGLVLYYNQDILDTAGETPPRTWTELRALAVKLTVPSANGIERGGLAIGNATNVEHFSDILAALILQNNGILADADEVETKDALSFYTNFQLEDKVWNEKLPSSTVAFARGDVAMMFAPSWRAHEVQALNPDLNFATAPLPQLSEDNSITWGSYWAEGISSDSDNKAEAAQFLAFLNKDETLKKFFSSASLVRSFGEIYPKVSMSEEIEEDTIMGAVLEDAVFAQSWYLNSYTHDNGINDQMIEYYKTAVNSIIDGTDVEDAQILLGQGVSQVLKQYGVSTK